MEVDIKKFKQMLTAMFLRPSLYIKTSENSVKDKKQLVIETCKLYILREMDIAINFDGSRPKESHIYPSSPSDFKTEHIELIQIKIDRFTSFVLEQNFWKEIPFSDS